jgi:hypothetical protein
VSCEIFLAIDEIWFNSAQTLAAGGRGGKTFLLKSADFCRFLTAVSDF